MDKFTYKFNGLRLGKFVRTEGITVHCACGVYWTSVWGVTDAEINPVILP